MQRMALLTTNAATTGTMRMCPRLPRSMPCPLYTVFNSNPTILLEGVDKVVDIVAANVPPTNAAVEVAAPQCLRPSHMLA